MSYDNAESLRRWVTIAGIALIALIIAADGYEAWKDYRTALSTDEHIQQALSRALAEQTARMIQEADVLLSDFAVWAASGEGRAADEQWMRERLQSRFMRLPFVYSATIAGADGHILATTQSEPIADRTLAKWESYTVPKQSSANGLYIGRLFAGRRDGLRTFALSRRIDDAHGGFAGVVAARIAFDYLAAFYAGINLTPDTSIRLARTDGMVLAQYPKDIEPIIGTPAPARPPGASELILARHPVEGYPITVEVARASSSVIAPWIHQTLGNAARTLVLAALAGLLLVSLRAALLRFELTQQERRRLERELASAQRADALGFLAASIAHDFNNVLTAVVGYAELARKSVGDSPTASLNLDRLLAATERARMLVRRILTFNPHRSVNDQPVLVEPLVDEVAQQIRATLPESIDLRIVGANAPTAVLGDNTEVHQVIMNLCSNAVKAMPSGGTLEIRLQSLEVDAPRALTLGSLKPGPWLCLSVTDTGAGLAPEQMTTVFEPFFTTYQPGQGSGIGLTVVRNIVLRMNGALQVDSRRGAGTCMSVYWPRAAVPQTAPPAVILPGSGETVMVVDDEPELISVGEEVLAALGFEPIGFVDARVALEAFRRDPARFDAVLTDERMASLRGLELAREIHTINPRIPILLMTGHRDPEIESQAEAAGIVEILDKPMRAETLRAALRRWLH
jgi:signal transduction histidine kinase